MRLLLSYAAIVLTLSLSASLGGCVHITNTYAGLPGGDGSQNQQSSQTVAARDCGCAGTAGPIYIQDGYARSYPTYYPPSSQYPYGYPPTYGGYYPRPNQTGDANVDGAAAGGAVSRPVGSTPRRTDSSKGRDVVRDTHIGGASTTVGINPGFDPPSSAPGGPRVGDFHDSEVRPNLPLGGQTREATPVSNVPEKDTHIGTVPPVRTGTSEANVPHDDVTMRPPVSGGPSVSVPDRGTRPAQGADVDNQARPRPGREPVATPVRTPEANPSGAAQRESATPVPTVARPRRESTPVNSGVSERAGAVENATETVSPAAGTGSRTRRETPVAEKSETVVVAPAAGIGSQAPAEQQKGTGEKADGASAVGSTVSWPIRSAGAGTSADSLKPAVGISTGSAGDHERISTPR